jgi:AAA domain, putative AbiEii toxin, Type IV TA system/AAA domain
MIKNVKFLNGFITKLPGFDIGKTIEFSDGLNIFLGKNGSGKSSALKILKAYTAIPEGRGAWSQISSELALGAQCRTHFPWVYREYSPGKSEAIVSWDGTPSFWNDGDVKIDKWAWFTHNSILSEDGMSTEQEQMQLLVDMPSSGQYRMGKINKMFNMLENVPDLTLHPCKSASERAEVEYIRTLPRNGKPTLILDEPERALSIPKQVELFKLLVKMTDKYQIIIATHSPFVLFGLDANIINLDPDYTESCLDIFRGCSKYLMKNENGKESQLELF